MKRKTTLIILTALLLVLALAFLDVRLAVSRDYVANDSTKATAGEGLPYAMRGENHISIAVTGDGYLAPALERKLAAALRASGKFAEVKVVPASSLKEDEPYLRVEVEDRSFFWTPVFATGKVAVKTGFGSNGSVDHAFSSSPSVFTSAEGPGIHTSAAYALQDTAFGLMTYHGYASLLADQFAGRIVPSLLELYEMT